MVTPCSCRTLNLCNNLLVLLAICCCIVSEASAGMVQLQREGDWNNQKRETLRRLEERRDFVATLPALSVPSFKGRSWAIVIGNDMYQDNRYPLQYASSDVQAISMMLKDQGFQVSVLLGERVTRLAVIQELSYNLAKRVQTEDRVVIYFSGLASTVKTAEGFEHGYLLTSDSNFDDLSETALSMKYIADIVDLIPAKQVLLMVDACYSGLVGRRMTESVQASLEVTPLSIEQRGRHVLTGGADREYVFESNELRHGIFTYYLLEGLGKGAADLNHDGVIPVSELHAYITAAVFSRSARQTPELWTMSAGNGQMTFTIGEHLLQDKAHAKFSESRRDLEAESLSRRPSAQDLNQLQSTVEQLEAEAKRAEENVRLSQAELDARRQAAARRIKQAEEMAAEIATRGAIPVKRDTAESVVQELGKAWAVVIGINVYRDKEIKRLTYAEADAEALGKELENQGFKVIPLIGEKATAGRIRELLGDELPLQVKPPDRVLIFFAGHGQDYQPEGVPERSGYLLPVDTDPRALHKTAIVMDEIRLLARRMPARQVLFLIDACYGGIAGIQARSNKASNGAALVRELTKEPSRTLITAGGAEQEAHESPVWSHSVFTNYLLEGLGMGLADLNDDGLITSGELHQFLEPRVFDAARQLGANQKPELWSLSADRGQFVFIPGQKVQVAVGTPHSPQKREPR